MGSILRTADGLGVERVILCGITPYPALTNDTRLPYLAEKIHKQISKTSLGAEESVAWDYATSTQDIITVLKTDGYKIAALEQTNNSKVISSFVVPEKLALVVGNEVDGVSTEVLKLVDETIEIPMFGHKESFNVSVAAAIAAYAIISR